MSARRLLGSLALAALLALLSSLVKGTSYEYQDWDCAPGVRECPRHVAAVGFPLVYVVDRNGLSPANSADLVGALMGVDDFRAAPFAADVLAYLALLVAADALRRRLAPR